MTEINHLELFDASLYLESNPDLKKNEVDLFDHWILHGIREGRMPNMYPYSKFLFKIFDALFYFDLYPDIKKNGINPFYHWYKYGLKENRAPNKKILDQLQKYPHQTINQICYDLYYQSSTKERKNILIIISHNDGGEISQYIQNIIDIYINNNICQSFDIYTNDPCALNNKNIFFTNNEEILAMINNLKENKNQKVIVHFNIMAIDQLNNFIDTIYKPTSC